MGALAARPCLMSPEWKLFLVPTQAFQHFSEHPWEQPQAHPAIPASIPASRVVQPGPHTPKASSNDLKTGLYLFRFVYGEQLALSLQQFFEWFLLPSVHGRNCCICFRHYLRSLASFCPCPSCDVKAIMGIDWEYKFTLNTSGPDVFDVRETQKQTISLIPKCISKTHVEDLLWTKCGLVGAHPLPQGACALLILAKSLL